MTRTVLAAAALLICNVLAWSAGPAPRGARAAALGGVSTALRGEVWCAVLNPALGMTLPGIRPALDVALAPFGLAELASAGIAVNAALGPAAVTLSATRMGGELYRETLFSAGVSIPVGPRGIIGVSGEVRHVRIRSYGSAASFALTLGACFMPGEQITVGAAVSQAAATRLGLSGERPEPTIQFGLSAGPLEGLVVGAEIWKCSRFPAELHAGVEYALSAVLRVRGGISQEPPGLTFGAGLLSGRIVLDYAAVFHPLLGPSHILTLVLCLTAS
jgi:hypothetical protein